MEGAEAGVGAGDLVDGGDEGVACLEGEGVGGERHFWRSFGGRKGGDFGGRGFKGREYENELDEVDVACVSPYSFYIRWQGGESLPL